MSYREPATDMQWAYLRRLATQTGQRLLDSYDRRTASWEIKRLLAIRRIQAQEATGVLF